MKRYIAFFAIVAVICMVLFGCSLSTDTKKYPDVAVGERFSSFGFDGYFRKLPNDYMIEVAFGEGNTVYKINNYDDVMQDAKKITEGNVEYYFCVESMVFLKCTNKTGETVFFSLDTTGDIGSNLAVYGNEAQLLSDTANVKIDWNEVRPKD